MNYLDFFYTTSPIIMIYIGNKVIKNGIQNYNLCKEFQSKNMPIQITPKGMGQIAKFDRSKALKLKFGSNVITFVETITQNIPHADFTYLYHNLENLEIVQKKLNMYSSDGVEEAYIVRRNKIVIYYDYDDNDDICFETFYHELFHVASTFCDKEKNQMLSGFSQGIIGETNQIGTGINEGYTQLLAERYFGQGNEIHPLEASIAKRLEQIIGKFNMESMYFKANLSGFVCELKKFETEETIMNFISKVDFLNHHLYDEKVNTLKNGMISNSLSDVSKFLLRCYVKKLKMDLNDGTLIDQDEFYERLMIYMKSLGRKIKFKNREYHFLSAEEIKLSLNDIIDMKEFMYVVAKTKTRKIK